jgi:hypothetical protein
LSGPQRSTHHHVRIPKDSAQLRVSRQARRQHLKLRHDRLEQSLPHVADYANDGHTAPTDGLAPDRIFSRLEEALDEGLIDHNVQGSMTIQAVLQ